MAERPISMYADLIVGYACVQQAATRANAEVGALDIDRAELIDLACDEIREGRLRDAFVVDILQNAGGRSMNDLYPAALKIGLCFAIERLLTSLEQLAQAFRAKAREFDAFAVTLAEDRDALQNIRTRLWEVNLALTVCRHLAAITGYDIVTAPNPAGAARDVCVFVELSITLKRTALRLSQVCSSIMPGMVHSFEPARAHILFEDLQWMTAAMDTLRTTALDQAEMA